MSATMQATTVTRMPTVPTPLVVTTALAKKDIMEMDARVQVDLLFRIITTDNCSCMNVKL